MPEVIDFRSQADSRDAIHRAAALLAEGEIVGLPTETAYLPAAHALCPDSVSRLVGLLNDRKNRTVSLFLSSAEVAEDYVPEMSRVVGRLTRRCWPGPVAFHLPVVDQSGLLQALPSETVKCVLSDQEVCVQVPGDRIVLDIMELLPAPLIVLSERGEESTIATADDLQQEYGDAPKMIIDNGRAKFDRPPTFLRVTGQRWSIASPGVVVESAIKRLASEMYVFVCTGNTCRSPMAEALFRKLCAEKLQCSVEELCELGYVAVSAGLAAGTGYPASAESVSALDTEGIDLRSHSSQQLTDQLLGQADRIFTMTEGHRESILSKRPDLAARVRLLSQDGISISDPYGGDQTEYEHCKQDIRRNIEILVNELVAEKKA